MTITIQSHSTRFLQDTYTRLFYTKARGYTPLHPDGVQYGSMDDDSYRIRWDVEIGDLVHRRGDVVLYAGINITKSAEDPKNQWQSLPKDYEPCSLEPGVDYTVHRARYPSPSVVSGADFDLNSIIPTQADGIERLKFSTSDAQGAYCALPFGGSSYECTASGIAKLRRYAMLYGASYYHQTVHVNQLDIQNGDLILVTGCERTAYWADGVFVTKGPNPRLTKMLSIPRVVDGVAQRIDMLDWCPLETTPTSLDFWTQSARGPDTLENEQACWAFRGFCISLKPSVYNDMRMPWGIRQTLWHDLPKVLRPPTRSWSLLRSPAPYHPTARIIQLMHWSDPRAKTVVVHDNDILSVIEPQETCLPSDAELARRMTARYVVLVDSAGRASLEDRTNVKLAIGERLRFWLWAGRRFTSVPGEHRPALELEI